MSTESKTARASSGHKKVQKPRLCEKCNQAMVPVRYVEGGRKGKMVWRHKADLMEACQ